MGMEMEVSRNECGRPQFMAANGSKRLIRVRFILNSRRSPRRAVRVGRRHALVGCPALLGGRGACDVAGGELRCIGSSLA